MGMFDRRALASSQLPAMISLAAASKRRRRRRRRQSFTRQHVVVSDAQNQTENSTQPNQTRAPASLPPTEAAPADAFGSR